MPWTLCGLVLVHLSGLVSSLPLDNGNHGSVAFVVSSRTHTRRSNRNPNLATAAPTTCTSKSSTALHYSTQGDGQDRLEMTDDTKKTFSEQQKKSKLEAYQVVANQDPEWYNQFVLNVLKEKTVEELGLPPPSALPIIPAASTLKSVLELEEEEDTLTAKDSTQIKPDPAATAPTLLDRNSTTTVSMTASNTSEGKVQESTFITSNLTLPLKAEADAGVSPVSQSQEQELLDATTEPSASTSQENATIIEMKHEETEKIEVPENSTEVNTVASQSNSSIVADTVSKAQTKESTGLEKEASPSQKQENSTLMEEQSMPHTEISDAEELPTLQKAVEEKPSTEGENLIVDTPVATDAARSSKEKVVDRSDKKSELTTLGYTQDEIAMLLPDVVDVILDGQMERPSSIPSAWISNQVEESRDNSRDLKAGPVEIGTNQSEPKDKASEASLSETRQETAASTDKTSSKGKSPSNSQDAAVQETSTGTNSTDVASDEEVILFFDISKQRLQVAPLATLADLGYNKRDLAGLRADIAASVMINKTPRPSRGIPSKWKAPKNKQGETTAQVVQVLPRSKAEVLLEEDRLKRPTTTIRERPPVNDRRKMAQEEERERRRKTAMNNRRSREKQAFNADGSPKNVYNVRKKGVSPGQRQRLKLDDPPTPRYWMDIDTFRDLLRKEAEIRLRLVGDDFEDAVKEECDWRLKLYKDWLWKLDKGVGGSMVPSRRERRQGIPTRTRMEQRGPRKEGPPDDRRRK
ncbi:expressed unknown protein [Seminavis robusta]|uniref:Uncharacterized protein n=1 Tax=Seminavis robusta TaxID=568900 RepID=A0A9N8ENH0_9STRA|nr:expressed unknown protein [Seminavis robusta]|eukprot:Sro1228_g254390.1 n/a (751) ;mRNA; r:8107-10359